MARSLLNGEYQLNIESTMSWINNTFNFHENALMLRAQRAEILAANLANADTPGFKARDVDFKSIMSQQISGKPLLQTTNSRHMSSVGNADAPESFYRTPTRAYTNGNTVETEVEKAAFAENAIQYQASLQFLDGKIKGLLLAIRGD